MNRAITIDHEYGSGGREIGKKLARRSGIPFYDKKLIIMIAEERSIEISVLGVNDEADLDLDSHSPWQVPLDYQIAMTQRIYVAQVTVIRSLDDKGPYVIVGRCANTILPDAVSIFVFVDIESRTNHITPLSPGLARGEVKANVLAMDRGRKAYHEYYSTTQWGDMNTYDICLNSGLAGVEGCLEIALTYIKYAR